MSGAGRRAAAPRGTRDVLPVEGRVRERIVDAAREAFARHAYAPIVTPTFEETEVFVRGVGTSTDVVRKEMYTFEDRSGRSLTLRPEGTAPVVRAFVEHGMHKLPLPVKLWYLAPMFRYEAPQSGRYREHWQFGAEAIGSGDPLLDVEVIALLGGVLRDLGVPGLRLCLGSMGDAETRAAHRPLLLEHLRPRADGLDEDARARMRDNPLRLFDSKDPAVREAMAGAPTLLDHLSPAAREHHDRVRDGLERLGIGYEEDPSLVRGFDYYTMTVFEFTSDRLGAQSAVGGGGRYDGLVEALGGPPAPGVGFGAGIERLLLALEEEGLADAEAPAVDVFVVREPDAPRELVPPLLKQLRDAGVAADADYAGRSLKGQLTQAGRSGAATTVILRAGDALIRRPGERDQAVAHGEVIGRIRR